MNLACNVVLQKNVVIGEFVLHTIIWLILHLSKHPQGTITIQLTLWDTSRHNCWCWYDKLTFKHTYWQEHEFGHGQLDHKVTKPTEA